MKITDQDIIRTAKNLRDEENEQLHVAPWHSNSRFHVPAWLVAVPAAAIIGFLFGLWVNSASKPDAPLTAMTDTVYIKVNVPAGTESLTPNPSPTREGSRSTLQKENANTHASSKASPSRGKGYGSATERREWLEGASSPTGRSIADDKIRYDLLLVN